MLISRFWFPVVYILFFIKYKFLQNNKAKPKVFFFWKYLESSIHVRTLRKIDQKSSKIIWGCSVEEFRKAMNICWRLTHISYYKLVNDDRFENYPLSALPIYFENYNIVFYENKDKNLLIIPCFLSLFTEYLILPHLKLEISGIFSEFFDFQANFEVIAYNSFSENSIIVHVQTNNEVNGESFPLLILLMSICCLVIFVGAIWRTRALKIT